MKNKDSTRYISQKIKENQQLGKIERTTAAELLLSINAGIRSFSENVPAVIKTNKQESGQTVELSKDECESLLQEISERYKWFNRFYVSSGRKEHVQFFNETDCNYNVNTADTRIPGIVRGPDQRQDLLPDEAHITLNEDVYLIPVHQVVQHAPFIEYANICGNCSVNKFPSTVPDNPMRRTDGNFATFHCPECGKESTEYRENRYRKTVIHELDSPNSTEETCQTDVDGKYEYMDWMTGASPGDTLKIPMEMPAEPTSLSGGFEIGWLPPAEPITSVPTEEESDLPVLAYIDHEELDIPVAVLPSDIRNLKFALTS